MKKFKVWAKATEDTFKCLPTKRTITGHLFVQVGDFFFPEKGWDDFVVVVLGWWIENAILLDGPVVEVDNLFMDGPYSFRSRREPGEKTVALTFLRDGQPLIPEKIKVPFRRYLAAIRGGTKDFFNQLGTHGESLDTDTQVLKNQLDKLMKLEAELDL